MAKLAILFDSDTGKANISVDGTFIEGLTVAGIERDPDDPQRWVPKYTSVWPSTQASLDKKFARRGESRASAVEVDQTKVNTAVASFFGKNPE